MAARKVPTVMMKHLTLRLEGDAVLIKMRCQDAYAARILIEDLDERIRAGQAIQLEFIGTPELVRKLKAERSRGR